MDQKKLNEQANRRSARRLPHVPLLDGVTCFSSLKRSTLCPVLLLTITLAVALPFLNAQFIYPAFANIVVWSIEEDARRLGSLTLPPSLKHTRLTRDLLTERFFGEIYKLEHDFGLMKVKIFSYTGEILYSTDTREIGSVNTKPYFKEVVAKGGSHTQLVKRTLKSFGGEEVVIDVVETYVPFMSGGRFLGAFEMYYDVTERIESMDRLASYSVMIMALLSACLVVVVAMLTRKEMARQRAMEQAEELKEEVERITHHDLKTPIVGILSGIEYLTRFSELTVDQTAIATDMRLAANTAMDMINRSLDLYKMEAGTYDYIPESMDLLDTSRRAARDLSGLALSAGVQLLITREGKIPRQGETLQISADETLVYSLLANLLKNGIEASTSGQQVTMTISGEDEIRITIHNPGIVPEAIRETFFDKYATAGKSSGTGLGTYSAKLITETMGGTITMTTAEDSGTMLTVNLPRSGQQKAS